MTGQPVNHEKKKDWTAADLAAYAAVDDALWADELAPTPPGLAHKVMRSLETQVERPRFRLAWLDYALSLFAVGMMFLVFLITRSLPPQLGLYLDLEALYWTQRILFDPLLPVMYLGGAALLVGSGLLLGMFVLRSWPAGKHMEN